MPPRQRASLLDGVRPRAGPIYEDLVELARMCARNARITTTREVADELWRMAKEYKAQAAEMGDDRVRQSLSARINGDEDVMQSLALIILRHVDQGESDPVRLSDVAFRELAGSDRSANGDRAATG
jgi:hypothetical protein